MPCGHLNAMRFEQKPLAQPAYSFVHVPKATPDLEHSSLQRISKREHFQACMAEMLLLGKEAVRRRKGFKNEDAVTTNSSAKPLSLEYLADRCDVDDPCFGFVVRTNADPSLTVKTNEEETVTTDTTAPAKVSPIATDSGSEGPSSQEATASGQPNVPETPPTDSLLKQQPTTPESHWKAGMLQGFITVTTFTNWQKSFRWDSLHPEAYGFDPPALIKQRLNGIRKWDADGTLAKELQQSVRCGDIWDDGIVWPRIAEISLLGGLGCGRTLVKLALEHLENLTPNPDQNYDYVVLQATDNSIPFYESLGFIRVGGIMEDRSAPSNKDSNNKENEQGPLSEIITSKTTTYVTQKRGEILQDVAKKHKADTWDVIFLNQKLFPDTLTPASKLLLGTSLQIPVPRKEVPKRVSSRKGSPTKKTDGGDDVDDDGSEENISWYNAKENDTPSKIAKQFNVDCMSLIRANAARLPGLTRTSRLRNGTRVQVSHFHIITKVWTAYSHWSFPDDEVEEGEPSYMMCYKLQKKQRRGGEQRPIQASLKTVIEEYTRTPLLLAPPAAPKDKSEDNSSKVEKRLEPAMDAAANANEPTPSTAGPSTDAATALKAKNVPAEPSTPVLLARDINRDTLVHVKVLSDGALVKPSPVPRGKPGIILEPPKRAPGPFVLFCQDMRNRKENLLKGLSIPDASRVLADRWQKAPLNVRNKYETLAKDGKQDYLAKKEAYNQQMAELQRMGHVPTIQPHHPVESQDKSHTHKHDVAKKRKKDHEALYEKIVKIKPEALSFAVTELPKKEDIPDLDDEDPTCSLSLQPETYKYWFVLTFVPDLQWCHLVPLVRVGEFSEEDKKARLVGRSKWKLVDERLCQEIDICSRYVVPVKSRETKRSADANKEAWDILDPDEEDVGSEQESSGRKSSSSGKKSRKRKKPASQTQAGHSEKKQLCISSKATPVPTSTLLDVETSVVDTPSVLPTVSLEKTVEKTESEDVSSINHPALVPTVSMEKPGAMPNMSGIASAAPAPERPTNDTNWKWAESQAPSAAQVSLPSSDLDFSTLQKPAVGSSCRNDESEEVSGHYPHRVHHQPPAYYHYPPYHHHSQYPRHQESYHYGYGHPMQDYVHDDGYYNHGPPPGYWHDGSGYQEHYPPPYHQHVMQAEPMYHHREETTHFPLAPAYPPIPPALTTPSKPRTSSAYLDLSVEREVAL
ncbi:expressed unknown protein [Seminavis robusta]|uniref:HMG box domain-containing protein n=1 Tax=Seminavis robusta TaxID=568900 RepID=A0A9N8E2H4_9STRA|nr:expressed unknown protein [Seminavis robusta]|eukprot:Sro478_g151080.1 n/a (1197) ;mRNA; r:56196-59962